MSLQVDRAIDWIHGARRAGSADELVLGRTNEIEKQPLFQQQALDCRSATEPQADVVFSHGLCCGLGANQITELSELKSIGERIIGKLVHQGREPPRKSRGLPNPIEGTRGVVVK